MALLVHSAVTSSPYCLFVVSKALVLGKTIAARPSKVIAGHEADRTNELLQALAEAINKRVCKIFYYITYLTINSDCQRCYLTL